MHPGLIIGLIAAYLVLTSRQPMSPTTPNAAQGGSGGPVSGGFGASGTFLRIPGVGNFTYTGGQIGFNPDPARSNTPGTYTIPLPGEQPQDPTLPFSATDPNTSLDPIVGGVAGGDPTNFDAPLTSDLSPFDAGGAATDLSTGVNLVTGLDPTVDGAFAGIGF